MSEGLLGVIIGGVIAVAGTVIGVLVGYKKWKTELMVRHLKEERLRLEKDFDSALEKILEGMLEGVYPSEVTSSIFFLYPKQVYDAFIKMLDEEDKTEKKMREHFFMIASSMKKTLAAIDKEISKLTGMPPRDANFGA